MSQDSVLPQLTAEVLTEIFNHARETYPEECCGFLLGPQESDQVDEVRRCVNEQNRYHELDPQSFPRTAREAYYLGFKDLRFLLENTESTRPIKIIYHSHPDVGAYFSEKDTRDALGANPDTATAPQYPVDHVVIDAQSDQIAGAKLFRWNLAQRSFVQTAEYTGER